jgi:hypothetical protein
MSKHIVKLYPNQQKAKPFKHPLLNDAKNSLTDVEIEELVLAVLQWKSVSASEKLILAHLPLLRQIIGRYLFYWPLTNRFLEDMVSAGVYAITIALNNLTEKRLQNKSIGTYLANHICEHIEIEISKLRGIAPAPKRTNFRRVKQGKDPIFGTVEASLTSAKDSCFYLDSSFEEVAIIDVLEYMEKELGKPEILFDSKLWGLSDSEAADEIGVPRRTVGYRRAILYKRFLELVGD